MKGVDNKQVTEQLARKPRPAGKILPTPGPSKILNAQAREYSQYASKTQRPIILWSFCCLPWPGCSRQLIDQLLCLRQVWWARCRPERIFCGLIKLSKFLSIWGEKGKTRWGECTMAPLGETKLLQNDRTSHYQYCQLLPLSMESGQRKKTKLIALPAVQIRPEFQLGAQSQKRTHSHGESTTGCWCLQNLHVYDKEAPLTPDSAYPGFITDAF